MGQEHLCLILTAINLCLLVDMHQERKIFVILSFESPLLLNVLILQGHVPKLGLFLGVMGVYIVSSGLHQVYRQYLPIYDSIN